MRPTGNGNDAPVTVAVALGAPERPAGDALAKRPGAFVGDQGSSSSMRLFLRLGIRSAPAGGGA